MRRINRAKQDFRATSKGIKINKSINRDDRLNNESNIQKQHANRLKLQSIVHTVYLDFRDRAGPQRAGLLTRQHGNN